MWHKEVSGVPAVRRSPTLGGPTTGVTWMKRTALPNRNVGTGRIASMAIAADSQTLIVSRPDCGVHVASKSHSKMNQTKDLNRYITLCPAASVE